MLLDITLKENKLYLKVHEKFLLNHSAPLALFSFPYPLMEKYSHLGKFLIEKPNFGFAGCWRMSTTDKEYTIYEFPLPSDIYDHKIRQMLISLYLASDYILDQIYYQKEYFQDTVWNDQSLSLIIFSGGSIRNGYEIGGKLYPWWRNKLKLLKAANLEYLNEYVSTELNRLTNYFNQTDLLYDQITIKRESFLIVVNREGRWLEWVKSRDDNKPESFSSHNIDHADDQFKCFLALLAMNTWLREN